MSLSGRGQPPAPSVLAGLVRERVVVTVLDDSGIDGVLWSADESGMLLMSGAGAPLQHIDGNGQRVDLLGSYFVPAHQIKFVQIPGGVND